MRFRVTNIKPGYCEIWANEHDGQRYDRMAVILRHKDGWHWNSVNYRVLPDFDNTQHGTRREAINDCMRTALKRLVERAIEQQPKESPHWHSPRRDAWCTVTASHLFTQDELEEIKKRLTTFERNEE